MTETLSAVPTTIITGFLGVGKTTALLDLFRHRPEGERWAVLVNEFGEIGIDGTLLDEGDGYAVREIPGGCICCSAGVQLQVHLARLLEEQRPDRLFIEPTGLADPTSIVDLLRRPWFADVIDLRAIITLTTASRFLRPRATQQDAFLAQIELADVLVANQADRATAEDLAAFEAGAKALWPPKQVVATTTNGVLDPAWLDLSPSPTRIQAVPVDPHLDHGHDHPAHGLDDVTTHGWVFPPDHVFGWEALQDVMTELAAPCEALPAGVLRLKGVFRTKRAWVLVQGDDERLKFEPFAHRRDSRVEFIVPSRPAPDWEAVERRLCEALA